MPRKPRLEAPGLMYHIVARGIERREIFKNESDYYFFFDRLGKILIDTATKCFAFCLIPNHFHLLLRSDTTPISSLMRRLLTSYAIYFNNRYKRAGHLFQNRYKSIICQQDAYLLELIRYIHLNPLRAGICKNLDDLGSYKYSGHSAILGSKYYSWYDTKDVIAYFGKTKKQALKKYLEFVAEGISMGKDLRFSGGGLKRSLNFPNKYPKGKQAFDDRILGDSDFVLAMQFLMEKASKAESKARIDEILEKTAKSFGLSYEQICGSGKTSKIRKARAKFAYRAVNNFGLSFAETARYLKVHSSTVSRLVEREKEMEG